MYESEDSNDEIIAVYENLTVIVDDKNINVFISALKKLDFKLV